jgi:hypothetical protein
MNGISNQYIENAIKELYNFFGIKELFSRAEKYLEISSHYTTETLKQITKYMEEFENYRDTLKQKTFFLCTDNKTMKKYTTRLYKIKNFFLK